MRLPPDELQRYVQSEIERWRKVVEQAGAAGSQWRWSSLGAGQARSVGHIRRQQADRI
jgi:hypothetical protein